MKTLSLWQPWASLIADGIKTIETRSWATVHRGPLAIHAALRKADVAGLTLLRDLDHHLPRHISTQRLTRIWDTDLPKGVVLAIADLQDCIPVAKLNGLPTRELLCGDFRAGRFGWIFASVRPLRKPFPVRGRQGLFNVEIPKEYLP